MPSRANKQDAGSEAWLVEGSAAERNRKPRAPAGAGAETSQWLAVPNPTSQSAKGAEQGNGSAPKRQAARARSKRSKADPARRTGLGALLAGPRERRLETKLRRAEEKLTAQQHELDEMRAYIERLEAKVRRKASSRPKRPRHAGGSGSTRSKAGSKPQSSSTSESRTRRRPSTKRKVDLNEATFEELRAIGLSVTQSSRVIAYRDVRGGYESFDEFEGIPGLSSETLSALRARAQL